MAKIVYHCIGTQFGSIVYTCKTMKERKYELFTVFMLILKLNNFQVLFYSKYSFSMIKNGFFCVCFTEKHLEGMSNERGLLK